MSIITIACCPCFLPGIAYNESTNEYLVVWIRSYCDPGDDSIILRDIEAQRLANNGTLIGDKITVASKISTRWGSSLTGTTANVVYNRAANEYLVVWEHEYSRTDFDIRARRVASDGRLVGHNISIATSGKNETRPVVAYNSSANEYLVVWEHEYSRTDLDIHARRVANDGRLVGNEAYIARYHQNETRPVVAYNSSANEYLVVWEHWYSDTDLDLHARRVSNDGRLVGHKISIATTSKYEGQPAVAYNNIANEYLIVWHSYRPEIGKINGWLLKGA